MKSYSGKTIRDGNVKVPFIFNRYFATCPELDDDNDNIIWPVLAAARNKA
jgi:hypothetical protein